MSAAKQELAQLEAIERTGTSNKQAKWGAGRDAHVVILKSGEGFFGIDINLVQEIVLMQDITEVPGSASYIAGMTDLRGRVVPVSEFATLLSNQPVDRTDETRILVVEHGNGHVGLIVDAVTEVMMVGGKQIEDATTVGSQQHEFIIAVAKLEEHLVSLVEVERLLDSAGREYVEQAA